MWRNFVVFVVALGVSIGVSLAGHAAGQGTAQDAPSPPKGPAEIIQQTGAARAARDAKLMQQRALPAPNTDQAHGPSAAPDDAPHGAPETDRDTTLPPGHPSLAGGGDQPSDAAENQAEDAPVGGDPHAHAEGAPALARRPLSSAEPSTQLAAGSVRAHVLDANERPVAGAELQLGTMAQETGRTSVAGRTGGDGSYVFDKLATGDRQAYRVNVLYQGAKYSSMPFRLPVDRGYEVVIRRLETTRDTRDLVLYIGATSIELKDERLKVVQQARLINIGAKTYVFPDNGQLVPLPADELAFQSEEVMTDQHLREDKGKGVRISGSVPPGEVTLSWGFDVPRTESNADLAFVLPWVTFAYRVLVDAAPGLSMTVDGLPAPELHEDNGRRFYVTEVVKRVGEEPLRAVNIHLRGIPGPGPLRFVAVGLALIVLATGVFVSRRAGLPSRSAPSLQALAQQRERLLARAAELEAERARGDIGPEFHASALGQLEDELAAVLYEQRRSVEHRAGS
jgi:hypothetical protein